MRETINVDASTDGDVTRVGKLAVLKSNNKVGNYSAIVHITENAARKLLDKVVTNDSQKQIDTPRNLARKLNDDDVSATDGDGTTSVNQNCNAIMETAENAVSL